MKGSAVETDHHSNNLAPGHLRFPVSPFSCTTGLKLMILNFILIYISPQINRAVKNKSYFYNCYGKEEKFYIENQG